MDMQKLTRDFKSLALNKSAEGWQTRIFPPRNCMVADTTDATGGRYSFWFPLDTHQAHQILSDISESELLEVMRFVKKTAQAWWDIEKSISIAGKEMQISRTRSPHCVTISFDGKTMFGL